MRKILSVGKYNMDGEMLGCGNFGRVELATHTLTNVKVRYEYKCFLILYELSSSST